MPDRNKNKIIRYSDFFRYSGKKMSEKERNSFERELQRDPFAEDAEEGFALITSQEASKDISSLKKQLKKKTERPQKLFLFRIAASIAVLMIVSSIFIVIERKSAPKQIASNADRTESHEIIESKKIISQAEKKELTQQPGVLPEKKAPTSVVNQKNPETLTIPENRRIAVYKQGDSLKETELKVADKYVSSEQTDVKQPSTASSKRSSVFKADGKIISSEDNMPVAGVTIVVKGESTGVITDANGNFNIDLPDSKSHTLVASYIGMETKVFETKPDTPSIIKLDPSLAALNEIVVTAYGINREKSEMETKPEGYFPPSPAGGKSDFDKYIRENLQWPDTLSSGQKAIVVLVFSVLTDGSIDSIKIIRSPGKNFSDEAIRLLRSGPSWKPAVADGQIIEDQVRLRIVFK
jgi:hypothetical protein